MDFYKNNLDALNKQHPSLAPKIDQISLSNLYEVFPSKSGPPTISCRFQDGIKKNLHSAYNPHQEAERFIDSCNTRETLNFMVSGFGLGYHVLKLIERVPEGSRIFIFEKELEIFRIACEYNDLRPIFHHPGVSFFINLKASELETTLSSEKINLGLNGFLPIAFKTLIDLHRPYYESLDNILQCYLNEIQLEIRTQKTFSRLFFKNTLDNLTNIIKSPGIKNLHQILKGTPAIIISAGPSLDKNIFLLKNAMDKAFLISAGTAFNPLLKSGIIPDFIPAIDPNEASIKAFNLTPPPSDTWLLFNPEIPKAIADNFKGQRIVTESSLYLNKWIAEQSESKGNFGKSLSVAHNGFLFAKFLGCNPIIFVGQDLAFHQDRLHCRNSFFENMFYEHIGLKSFIKDIRRNHNAKYAYSLVPAKGLFNENIITTVAMNSYRKIFSEQLGEVAEVLNATEGGNPIPGVPNITLREILRTLPHLDKIRLKNILIKTLDPVKFSIGFADSVKKLYQDFNRVSAQVKSLKTSLNHEKFQKETFLKEMDQIYRNLIVDKELIQMMQNYAYEEFMEWNQANYRLVAKSQYITDAELIQAKFERDQTFLETLIQASTYLEKEFKKVYSQLQNVSLAKF